MTEAIKCDKCGKFEEGNIFITIDSNYAEIGVPNPSHLCSKCGERLKDWLRQND